VTEARDYFVYLIHDRLGIPVYVGQGRGSRTAPSTRRNRKIDALISFGGTLKPVKVKTGLRQAEAHEAEKVLIAAHGRADLGLGNLLNLCDGGAGLSNPAAEVRAKIIAAMTVPQMYLRHANLTLGDKIVTQIVAPAARAAMSAASKGRPLSAALIAAAAEAAAARKGKPGPKASDETRAKMSAARRGRKMSPEAIAKTAAAHRGMKRSEETREKIRAAQSNPSAETRAKIAASMTGRKLSPESIAKREATRRAKGIKLTATQRAALIASNVARKGNKQSPESIAKRVATRAANRLAATNA
jgi:hypothetical protein